MIKRPVILSIIFSGVMLTPVFLSYASSAEDTVYSVKGVVTQVYLDVVTIDDSKQAGEVPSIVFDNPNSWCIVEQLKKNDKVMIKYKVADGHKDITDLEIVDRRISFDEFLRQKDHFSYASSIRYGSLAFENKDYEDARRFYEHAFRNIDFKKLPKEDLRDVGITYEELLLCYSKLGLNKDTVVKRLFQKFPWIETILKEYKDSILLLERIFTGKDGKKCAIINGKVLLAGDKINDCTVLEIDKDRVVLVGKDKFNFYLKLH